MEALGIIGVNFKVKFCPKVLVVAVEFVWLWALLVETEERKCVILSSDGVEGAHATNAICVCGRR